LTFEIDALRSRLVEALRAAHASRKGVPPAMQADVRAWARAQREAGIPVGQVLVEVKAMMREHTGHDEPVFKPRIVGWTVAGYFEGAVRD
jgi:hypothetical protein